MALSDGHLTTFGPPCLIAVLIRAARGTLGESHGRTASLLTVGATETSGKPVCHTTVLRVFKYIKTHVSDIWILISYWS
jgi:hypothetical protein